MSLPDFDLDSQPPEKRSVIHRLWALKAADKRIRVRRRVAREMLGCAEWALTKLEDSGAVETMTVNGQVWILVGSIYDAMINDVLAPTPASSGKAPQKPRAKLPRSPAQLAALRAKNEQRIAEARERHERREEEATADA